MKIAVVGCGAVGSYYGGRLCRDAHEVHFLLRSDYEIVRRHGVQIRSSDGDFTVHPECARHADEIGPVDLVVVALKTTANAEFARLLPALVDRHTAVLTLQNGLGNAEQLAALFGAERVLGGMCFVCINRPEPGVIIHLAHGRIMLGEFQRWPEPRTHDLAAQFRHAGVPCDVADNLERAQWEKLVWNVPFNGLGVAGAAGYDAVLRGELAPGAALSEVMPTDRLLGDQRWETLVRELMLEVVAVANAKGLGVDPATAEEQIERTRSMGAYKASTLIDFERGLPLELGSVFRLPLEHARRTGVATPRLEALCRILEQLDPATRLSSGRHSTARTV
jgi:2-dehydropantoate 2-reductase